MLQKKSSLQSHNVLSTICNGYVVTSVFCETSDDDATSLCKEVSMVLTRGSARERKNVNVHRPCSVRSKGEKRQSEGVVELANTSYRLSIISDM